VNALLRKWGEHLIRSPQYAAGLSLIVAFLSFFNLPIGWLSSVIIAMITLQNGPRQGLMVMAWTILPAVAMLYLGQFAIFINAIFLHYLLILAFATILRKYHSWTLLLQLSTCLGIVGVILTYYLAPEVINSLVNQLLSMTKEYKTMPFFKSADIDIILKYIGTLATGLLALAIIMSNLVTLFVARWWQSILVSNISLQKEYHYFRMPYVASLLLIGISIGIYFNESLFINILVVAFMPFIFCGLSLFHAYSNTKKNGHILLIVLYGLLFCLSLYVILILTLIGWLDSFLNIRKKITFSEIIEEKSGK
jgi:MFS family permease